MFVRTADLILYSMVTEHDLLSYYKLGHLIPEGQVEHF